MRIQRREMGCLKLGHFATEPRTHAEFRELPDRVEPSSRRKESGAKHARMVKRKRLKQAENDFDVDAASHRFAVRSASGTHSPVLHCGDGLFLQAESRPLEIGRASCRERVKISVVAGALKEKLKDEG